jgi:hypothetical protein
MGISGIRSLTTRRFSIRNVLITHTQLIECLQLLPAVETLIIVDFIDWPDILMPKPFYNNTPRAEEMPSVFPGVLGALTWRPVDRDTAAPPLVPKLTTLTLAGRFNDDTLLVDMIESRWRSPPNQDPEVAKLKHVCLEFHRCFMEDSARKRIRTFEGKGGLEIRVIENSWRMSV